MGGSPAGEWPDGGSTSPGKRNALEVFEICRQSSVPPRPAIANGSQLKPAGLAQSNDTPSGTAYNEARRAIGEVPRKSVNHSSFLSPHTSGETPRIRIKNPIATRTENIVP
ncbi:hypothetical protein CIHG_01242 [Coccidioides immitis H538.4]|uniref:Uncharacterized protein n=1 Tax=Coccidioides immitis H538.4 TaxID=396776 RepID=A0A0J8RE04_COCIT|nr:hypothetical protein CIHG_01242 [Coccidioides immitis H538.4]